MAAGSLERVGSDALAQVEAGATVLDVNAGIPMVDEPALLRALQNGRLAGAGLDVLESEPPGTDNPLLNCSNVIVTPHSAWYSEQSTERLKEQGMDEIVRVLKGARPRYIVNPEVLCNQTP